MAGNFPLALLFVMISVFYRVTCMEPPLGGFSPLHLAVMNKNDDVTEVLSLLNDKADINRKTNNARQEAPLHGAVRCGNVAIVRLLLERGAHLHAENSGRETALKEAERRIAEFYRLFAAFGYTFNENDWHLIEKLNSDQTSQKKVFYNSLECAAARGDMIQVLCLLLDKQNEDHVSHALVFAVGQGHEEIVDLLLHVGARGLYACIVAQACFLRLERLIDPTLQDENLKNKKETYQRIREKLDVVGLLKNLIFIDDATLYFGLVPSGVRENLCLPYIFPSFFL